MSDENQKLTQEELLWRIYESTEKARKYILWGRIMTVIYLILILAPIIFAVIYLPPLLKNIIQPYQDLLRIPSSAEGQNVLNNVDLKDLMKMYR